MKRIAIAAILFASACTGTYYPYTSSGPQYAQTTQTQQVTAASADGTSTQTSSSTETYTFVANEAQPAAAPAQQAAPQPAPAADDDDDASPPPAPSICDPQDSPAECAVWETMVDIGDILGAHKEGSCRKAAADLNRYADQHAADIEAVATLEQHEKRKKVERFQARHQLAATTIMTSALDLHARCDDVKVDNALSRVGFRGML